MVYPGKPSTGCSLCRKRKVKCDEGKPTCRRCFTYGKECPGYSATLEWRPHTPSQFPLENLPKNVNSDNYNKGLKYSHRTLLPAPTDYRILDQPVNWEQRALGFFAHQHTLPSENGAPGHLEYLPELYSRYWDSECLNNAILSVSYQSLFGTTGLRPLYMDARKHYGKALTALNAALQSQDTVLKDSTLVSVLLLSMFVDLSGDRNRLSNSHLEGIYALVLLRGKKQLDTVLGSKLFGWALTQLQIEAIVTGQHRYSNLAHLADIANQTELPYNAGQIACNISSFHQYSTQFERDISGPRAHDSSIDVWREKAKQLREMACCVVNQIDDWEDRIPEHWRCYADSTVGHRPLRGVWTASFLSLFRAAPVVFYLRILGIRETLYSADLLESPDTIIPGFTAKMVEDKIRCLLNDICTNIPLGLKYDSDPDQQSLFGTGRCAGGYIMLWPMWVVANCQLSAPEQVLQSQDALRQIGKNMGFKQALSLLRIDSFPPLFGILGGSNGSSQGIYGRSEK